MSAAGASPSAPARAARASGWVRVGSAASFAARTTVAVHGRRVTLLRLRKRGTAETRWQCLDATCYHAGGPLGDGDLVAAAGRTCLRCPWHAYLIDVFSGEGVYRVADGAVASKGLRQRVHHVEARDDGGVYVRLNLAHPPSVPSDDYAYSEVVGQARQSIPGFP